MKGTPQMPSNNFGGGMYEFDMSISTLMRINYYLYISNQLSGSENIQGLKDWFDAVRVVDREIHPLLNDEEQKELNDLRRNVDGVLNLNMKGLNRRILYERVDSYERKVRSFVHKCKIYMKESEDAGKALLR